MTDTDKYDEIELRSEKNRKVIGKIPSFLLRNGILGITFVVLILLLVSYFIPYNETVESKITLYPQIEYTTISSPSNGVFMSVTSKNSIGFIKTIDSIIPIKIPSHYSPIQLIDNNSYLIKGDVICYLKENKDNDKFYLNLRCSTKLFKKIEKSKKIIVTFKDNPLIINSNIQNYTLLNNGEYSITMKIQNRYTNILESYIYKNLDAQIIIINESILKSLLTF